MSRQLTVRGVSDEVIGRLERLSRARGQSVNATMNQILEDAMGLDERRRRLARYATWTPADFAEFSGAVAAQRKVDEVLGVEPIDRLVLDTSAYSHMRIGHAQVLDLVAAAEIVLLPFVVIGELEAAFELGSRATENRVTLAEFLAEPFVSVLEMTREVAHRYGQRSSPGSGGPARRSR